MIKFTIICLLLGALISSCRNTITNAEMENVVYPEVWRDSAVVDDYHGKQVPDPYRWLENENSEETKKWVAEQNEITFSFLESIPYRDKIRQRLTELWNYEKYSSPFKEAGSYYYFKNDGLQNQNVLYRMSEGGEDELILDPNTFSADGTTSLAGISFSKDGKYLAYQVSTGGSDWAKAYVLDIKSGKQLSDEINWIKFSILSWEGEGFYYSRFPASESGDELSGKNEFHSLYYHKLGTDQSSDQLIYRDEENPQRTTFAQTTEDEKYLIISIGESTSGNGVKVMDLSDKKKGFFTLVSGFENDYRFIDNEGSTLIFLTNHGAPKQKLVACNFASAERNWSTLIAETDDVIQDAGLFGGKVYIEVLHNAHSKVSAYSMDGKLLKVLELPGIGSVTDFRGKREDSEAFFSFSSFTAPGSVYSLDTRTQSIKVFKSPDIPFKLSDYVTEQVWYESIDGTKVPMFLVHHKNLKKNGLNPTLLYGYGGFNVSMTPGFSPSILPLLENGGIYALANIRGGGEFGKEWHTAGTKERKQNVFDDFQAAAIYLIDEKLTSSDKLAIRGGSNGGLLVGASITQRPDLYKVAFPAVGVLDMLRYHKFTIGWAWATDYGRSDNPEDFEYLMAYSPLHNVRPASYPATLITTADHDDRVVPAHSFKFASELQFRQQGRNPVLIRIETSAGHGAGKPTSKIIEEQADILSFMFYNMNEEVKFEIKG